MPRPKKPLRARPASLEELDEALKEWNPLLEAYNRRLRAFDTEEEARLIELGRATYPERLAARRKELREAATEAIPLCPITDKRPTGKISGFTLQRAVEHIAGLPRIDRAVLCALSRDLRPEKNGYVVWPCVATIAARSRFGESSVQAALGRLEARKYAAVQIGHDRKGDSRLRPDKPRAGGRKHTTRWDLNVNGIFALAYAERPDIEDRHPSPSEPEEKSASSIEKGPLTTRNGPPTIEKGVAGGPEQTYKQTDEKTNQQTNTAENPVGCFYSLKPSANPETGQALADEKDGVELVCSVFSETNGEGKPATLGKRHKELEQYLAAKRPSSDELRESVSAFVEEHPWNDGTTMPLYLYVQNFVRFLDEGKKRCVAKAALMEKHTGLLADPEYSKMWEVVPEEKRSPYRMEQTVKGYTDEVQISNAWRRNRLESLPGGHLPENPGADQARAFDPKYITSLGEAKQALSIVLAESRRVYEARCKRAREEEERIEAELAASGRLF